jgi:hypothetical protein
MGENMSIGTFALLFCASLLGGCVMGNLAGMGQSDVCGRDQCQKIGNNPYAMKIKEIRKGVTTPDQIYALFGDPESVRESTDRIYGGRVQHYLSWDYISDEYESPYIPYPQTYGTWANGVLKVEFLEGRVDRVFNSERPSRPERPYWTQTNPKMGPEELARVKQLEKKWQADTLATAARVRYLINEGEIKIPSNLVRKALLADMKGGACNDKFDMELNIKTAHNLLISADGVVRTFGFTVTGSLKAADRSGAPGKQAIEIPMAGNFDLVGGFLHLSASNPNLGLELARDVDGKGWSGAVIGGGFGSCNDLALANTSGTTTNELPPITGKLALMRAQRLQTILQQKENAEANAEASSAALQEHWMQVAKKQGNDDALYYLAQFYEKNSRFSPEYSARAIQYYTTSSEKAGDVRAQQALGKMYAEGRGTKPNPVEAQRFNNLASATLKRAAELCTARPVFAAIRHILKEEASAVSGFEMLAGMVTGMNVDSGGIVWLILGADDVTSLNKPFVCNIQKRRVNASYDASEVPDYVYSGRDQNGTYYSYTSPSGTVIRASAALMNAITNNVVYKEKLRIEPLGGTKFKISKNDPERKYATTVEVR